MLPHTPSKAIELTFNAPVTLPLPTTQITTPHQYSL